MRQQASELSPQFAAKKQSILSQLALDPKDYEDKSPKGSVDVPILDLLRLINGVDGWVTTSSCSGRVAVFVEGPKKVMPGPVSTLADRDDPDDASNIPESQDDSIPAQVAGSSNDSNTRTAPGGKGGGHWLYVSHDPLNLPSSTEESPSEHWTNTFNLTRSQTRTHSSSPAHNRRLVHLSFSPLILHVLCASLQHARPLLAAAINAGFRESGVQSLKALEPGYVGDGVMVAIRTNGILFETIVGTWNEEPGSAVAVVEEGYLRLCAEVVNERFGWNAERKERLVGELQRAIGREGLGGDMQGGETKEERRERKRREGLERQQAARREEGGGPRNGEDTSSASIEDISLEGLAIT